MFYISITVFLKCQLILNIAKIYHMVIWVYISIQHVSSIVEGYMMLQLYISICHQGGMCAQAYSGSLSSLPSILSLFFFPFYFCQHMIYCNPLFYQLMVHFSFIRYIAIKLVFSLCLWTVSKFSSHIVMRPYQPIFICSEMISCCETEKLLHTPSFNCEIPYRNKLSKVPFLYSLLAC